jgi:transcriptional regulator of acetoin/glycerol metabolism
MYADRVPKQRYSPPNDEVAARIGMVVRLFHEQEAAIARYKAALKEITDKEAGDGVPIAHMATELGIERKTVYRHLGRSMT